MAFLQKKKEILRKAIRVVLSAVCLSSLVFMTAGCGKVEEPVPVQLSSGNVEELQNDTIGELENGSEEAAAGDVNSDPEDVPGGESKVDADDDMSESAGNGSENNTAQKTSRTDEERDANEDSKELEGNVRSIGADSFVAARVEVWSDGDADYAVGAAPGYEKEEDLITVYVNQDCVWEFKTVKNGGINPEDVSSREGSFSDLKEGISVHIKGSWQDNGSFLADSIVMMQFV